MIGQDVTQVTFPLLGFLRLSLHGALRSRFRVQPNPAKVLRQLDVMLTEATTSLSLRLYAIPPLKMYALQLARSLDSSLMESVNDAILRVAGAAPADQVVPVTLFPIGRELHLRVRETIGVM